MTLRPTEEIWRRHWDTRPRPRSPYPFSLAPTRDAMLPKLSAPKCIKSPIPPQHRAIATLHRTSNRQRVYS